MAKLYLEETEYDNAPNLGLFEDRTVFQTKQWLKFISSTQNAEPIIAVVKEGNRSVGRFTGLIVKKYGMRILGSPLPGWTTSYMGFNLRSSVSRTDALLALEKFAFRELKCVHFEVMDRGLSVDDIKNMGYRYRIFSGYEIDLNRDEDQIFAAMKASCRRCIRKAYRLGVQVEETKDLSFIDNYYSQLEDVFAKQKLIPTYSKKRVRALIEHLLESDLLLLVKATDSKRVCIATGIFPAMNDTMYFWGGASWRNYQILRPNESVQWFAIRYWKAKGITRYDMGGGGEYKKKYGGKEIKVPWIRKSRHPIFEYLRGHTQYLYAVKQRFLGLRKG